MYLFVDIGRTLVSDIVQILAGCLIAAALLGLAGRRIKKLSAGRPGGYIAIAVSAVCGTLFPMGTFGILPAAAAAYTAGAGCYAIIPAIMANTVFNTLVPFTDVGFTWKAGIYRILTALIIGVCSGLLLKLLNIPGDKLVRVKTVEAITGGAGSTPGFLRLANNCLVTVGPYLICGVILNTLFMKYIFYNLLNGFGLGPIATSLFSGIRGYDITTPVFLQIMIIFNSLMNIKTLAALFSFFRWKNIPWYYVYFAVWAAIVAVVNVLFR